VCEEEKKGITRGVPFFFFSKKKINQASKRDYGKGIGEGEQACRGVIGEIFFPSFLFFFGS
jgi:hypothetical protein